MSPTKTFYALIGIGASFGLSLLFYWSLRLNSSIASIINNTYGTPLYFWPYVILTFGTIILFGISISMLAYRWRKFGLPKFKGQAGTGFGSLVGVAASACPVCGSAILSAIGITAGLAAFPLQGLELKALSFGLMALPLWLMRGDLKKLECNEDGICPTPKDASYKEKDEPWLLGLVVLVALLIYGAWAMLKTDPALANLLTSGSILKPNDNKLYGANVSQTGNKLFDETAAEVLSDFQSKIYLGDSIVKLVENGVIDKDKFEAVYQSRGGLPEELKNVLTKPSYKPVYLTGENANYYVNLLWPLGLANYISTNNESPILGKSLFNFASTGGWNLGKEDNGGVYFNKFKIVELTPVEEALVTKIAQNAYRPCCNNSTFFQDCNHGSALLGLLQLGASQGLTEDELYREALAFNSFWFPHNYIQTALYFKAVKNTDWEKVDPKEVMGKVYSSATGAGLIAAKINELGLAPQGRSGGSCGI